MESSTNSLNERIELLKRKKHFLGSGDESFAHSLIQFFESRGFLSNRQKPYVEKLLERCAEAEEKKAGDFEEIFDGTQVWQLFRHAAQKLKFPSLRFSAIDGSKVVFYRAGPLSKSPGTIVITNGQKFPNKAIFGSIDLKGQGTLRRNLRAEIKAAIRKVAANPVEQAKLVGQQYSNCCFCGLELTAKISLYHGYGPICAANWGLPWEGSGEETETEKIKEEEKQKLANIHLEEI